MTKELLQHTWWALGRGSRELPGGPQGSTAPQFGKHCNRGTFDFAGPLGKLISYCKLLQS